MPGRDAFTPTEEIHLLSALAQRPLRDQALILTAMDTGFRGREIASLTVAHVLGENGEIRDRLAVERRRLKHGSGAYRATVATRVVPISARAKNALRSYLRQRFGEMLPDPTVLSRPLFLSRHHRAISIWRLNDILHELAGSIGCDADKRIGSHSLRKTFAQRVHAAGRNDINLTRVALGHRSVLTTQRYLAEDHARAEAIIAQLGSAV